MLSMFYWIVNIGVPLQDTLQRRSTNSNSVIAWALCFCRHGPIYCNTGKVGRRGFKEYWKTRRRSLSLFIKNFGILVFVLFGWSVWLVFEYCQYLYVFYLSLVIFFHTFYFTSYKYLYFSVFRNGPGEYKHLCIYKYLCIYTCICDNTNKCENIWCRTLFRISILDFRQNNLMQPSR